MEIIGYVGYVESLRWTPLQTITLKMADQRSSEIYVVSTNILCCRNFCVW